MKVCAIQTRYLNNRLVSVQHIGMVSVAILAVFLSSCRSAQHPDDKYRREMPEDYRRMVDIADRNASRDQLPKILADEHKVSCSPSPMKDISRAAFESNGQFAVLDSSGPGVYLFANNGSDIGELGTKGRGPGQYKIPWSVASTGSGFAVADFEDHRVNIYGYDQHLSSSFIYSVQRFSATGIRHDKIGRKFFLFGNHLQISGERKAVDFVHVYSDNGEFQSSIYQLPTEWLKANYVAVDTPLLTTDEKQNQYFMFEFDRILHRINQSDSKVDDVPLTLPGFIPPPTPLTKDQRGLESVLSWDLKYTPIRSLAGYHGATVVEYESHHGLRYTIAVFKNGSSEPSQVVETNNLLLGINSDGMAVFTNNPGSSAEDIHELTYGRFTI